MIGKMDRGPYRWPRDAVVEKHLETMKETSAKLEPVVGMAATVLDEWEDQVVYRVSEIQADGTLMLRRDRVISGPRDANCTYAADPDGARLKAEKHEDGQWHVCHATECCLVLLGVQDEYWSPAF